MENTNKTEGKTSKVGDLNTNTKEQIKESLKARNNCLYEQLVPSSGMAPTREGEMLRAINKIAYRWFNDGDHFDNGYGCETAGPAHAYLVSIDTPIRTKLKGVFSRAENTNDVEYSSLIDEALEIVVSYVESCEGKYSENHTDMLDYESLFEGDNDYEEEDDDYEEDEEDN